MSAYKFVEDGEIVWAGNAYYYWHARCRQPFACVTQAEIAEKAELIQDKDGDFCHAPWLHALPENASGLFEESDAVEISDDEYEAIRAVLDEGGTVEEAEAPATEDKTAETEEIEQGLDYLKEVKIQTLNKACNEKIVAGFSIALSDGGTYSFDLTLEDQSNLLGLLVQVSAGATECDYYTSDGTCLTLSAADMVTLSNYATLYKSYHIAYYHCLTTWVDALETVSEVAAVSYGDVVPEAYRNAYLIKYATALGVAEYAQTAE